MKLYCLCGSFYKKNEACSEEKIRDYLIVFNLAAFSRWSLERDYENFGTCDNFDDVRSRSIRSFDSDKFKEAFKQKYRLSNDTKSQPANNPGTSNLVGENLPIRSFGDDSSMINQVNKLIMPQTESQIQPSNYMNQMCNTAFNDHLLKGIQPEKLNILVSDGIRNFKLDPKYIETHDVQCINEQPAGYLFNVSNPNDDSGVKFRFVPYTSLSNNQFLYPNQGLYSSLSDNMKPNLIASSERSSAKNNDTPVETDKIKPLTQNDRDIINQVRLKFVQIDKEYLKYKDFMFGKKMANVSAELLNPNFIEKAVFFNFVYEFVLSHLDGINQIFDQMKELRTDFYLHILQLINKEITSADSIQNIKINYEITSKFPTYIEILRILNIPVNQTTNSDEELSKAMLFADINKINLMHIDLKLKEVKKLYEQSNYVSRSVKNSIDIINNRKAKNLEKFDSLINSFKILQEIFIACPDEVAQHIFELYQSKLKAYDNFLSDLINYEILEASPIQLYDTIKSKLSDQDEKKENSLYDILNSSFKKITPEDSSNSFEQDAVKEDAKELVRNKFNVSLMYNIKEINEIKKILHELPSVKFEDISFISQFIIKFYKALDKVFYKLCKSENLIAQVLGVKLIRSFEIPDKSEFLVPLIVEEKKKLTA